MSRRPRRNHTPAFKAKVALAAIKGDRTLVQLAEQFDVHPNQITSWKAQLEGGAADVFRPRRSAQKRPLITVTRRADLLLSPCHPLESNHLPEEFLFRLSRASKHCRA